MFIGHYAAAFVLRGKEKNVSLGALFIATQFVDILYFPFALVGIEHLKFEKNFTAVNNFNMDFFPFTHSLFASILWAILCFLLYYYVLLKNTSNKKTIAFVMALGVLSHWFTDYIVHTPDLPLFYGEPKYGLGLWQNRFLTYLMEATLLILGFRYYLEKTIVTSKKGKYIGRLFIILLLFISYLDLYILPKNDSILLLTISALTSYFIFAKIAYYIDKHRY